MSVRGHGRVKAITASALLLTGCAGGVLDPQGPVGRGDATILLDALAIMLVIVVPTIVLAFLIAWRYRASNTKAEYLPDWSFSGRIEAITWSIPILTIMFLGGVIWIGSYQLDPFRRLPSKVPAEEVQVVSLDWKWLFIYPKEGIATVNQLVLPIGTPVHFSITSASVFNTFFIPQLGSMIYAMPGMVSQLNLQADRPADCSASPATSAATASPTCSSRCAASRRRSSPPGCRARRGAGGSLDRASYAELVAAEPEREALHLRRGRSRRCSPPSRARTIAAAPGPQPENAAHAGREVSTGGKD